MIQRGLRKGNRLVASLRASYRPSERCVVHLADNAESTPPQGALDAVFEQLLVGGKGHFFPPLVGCI